MLDFLRSIFERRTKRKLVRSRHDHALRKAAEHFIQKTGIEPMGCVVVSDAGGDIVVRVMHVENRIPPERTWYVVRSDGSIATLSGSDGAKIDTVPWR